MIRPHVLLVQPLHLTYPVCEWNLNRFKKYFSSITIMFSDHHVPNQDLTNFVKTKIPFANFLKYSETFSDWRNGAVNEALDKMPKDGWVLFLEQDFLIKDDSFWEKVLEKERDFIYYKEGERTHPAFALVKRELVDKTKKDFSFHPLGDHFYLFFKDLYDMTPGTNIEELGVVKREDYFHMAGLSQNYHSFKYGDPFFMPNNFLYYNYLSLKLPDQHPLMHGIEEQIEMLYGHPKTHTFLTKFFPI